MDSINLIENPRLDLGNRKPEDWKWSGGQTAEWQWASNGSPNTRNMVVIGDSSPEFCGWRQRFDCEGNEHYRFDIQLTVEPGSVVPAEHEGAVILLQAYKGTRKVGTLMRMPAPNSGKQTVRGCFNSPVSATQVELSIGLVSSDATMVIHEAIAVPVLEPETKGHPVAIPQPPYEYPFPKKVENICIVSETEDRPIVSILKDRFGENTVAVVAPASFKATTVDAADAVIIPDDTPLACMKSLNSILKLAKDTLLVLSLRAFESLDRKALKVRTIRSKDDPIYATVREANFITRGFALRDCFPYFFGDPNPRFFRQSHFKESKAFKAWIQQNKFDVVLRTETDSDTTSDMPMALYRATENGGIVVLDTTPVEAHESSANESSLAAWILFNILGVEQYNWGQFTAPARTHREFWDDLFESDKHFPELTIHGVDHPYKPEHNPIVELAGDPGIDTLPVEPRPTVLIRTGLRGFDYTAQYGVLSWMKNLVRPWPFTCPYLSPLSSHYRTAWVIAGIPYSDLGGTGIYTLDHPECETVADFEPDSVALVVDFVTDLLLPENRYEISVAGDPNYAKRLQLTIETILPALLSNRYYTRTNEPGIRPDYVETRGWRSFEPEFAFSELDTDRLEFHEAAIKAGATVLQVKIPDHPGNLISHSICRTDIVATLIEQIIGAHLGLMAFNRTSSDIQLPASDELLHGIEEMFILRHTDTPGEVDGESPSVRKGKITLAPREAICGIL